MGKVMKAKWLNLGNISLVWIAEIWTITATESKKSIIIASPNLSRGR